MKTRQGFTLIELLVVVLIIGILSAVALPQYTKAVDKAEMAKVLSTFKTIRQAMVVYYLENDTWPTDLSMLDVQIPEDSKWIYELEPSSSGKESCVWPDPNWIRGWASIRARRKEGTGGAVFYSIPERKKGTDNFNSGIFCCLNFAATNKDQFRKFCQVSAHKDTASAGACYQGEHVHVRLE